MHVDRSNSVEIVLLEKYALSLGKPYRKVGFQTLHYQLGSILGQVVDAFQSSKRWMHPEGHRTYKRIPPSPEFRDLFVQVRPVGHNPQTEHLTRRQEFVRRQFGEDVFLRGRQRPEK